MSEIFKEAKQYQMITEVDPGTLSDKVDTELSMGWHLFGSPMCAIPGPDEYPIWSQALVRVD